MTTDQERQTSTASCETERKRQVRAIGARRCATGARTSEVAVHMVHRDNADDLACLIRRRDASKR
ncbi:hypothetical protein, partial [Escherichia coli]|uniref:hypothetical protein n=1 Tax=Escherichia coli TaxID=562 RepID=UPI0019D680F9